MPIQRRAPSDRTFVAGNHHAPDERHHARLGMTPNLGLQFLSCEIVSIVPRHATNTEKSQYFFPMPPSGAAGPVLVVEIDRYGRKLFGKIGDGLQRYLARMIGKAAGKAARLELDSEAKTSPRRLRLPTLSPPDDIFACDNSCDPDQCVILFGEADFEILDCIDVAGDAALLLELRTFGQRAGITIIS
jgi:hypothetical protein